MKAAQEAFLVWRRAEVERRRDVGRLLGKTLLDHVDELATLLTTEQGKHLAAHLRRKFPHVLVVRGAGEARRARTQTDETDTHTMITRRVPLGVVAAIVPPNFPVSLAMDLTSTHKTAEGPGPAIRPFSVRAADVVVPVSHYRGLTRPPSGASNSQLVPLVK
ncbi:aldehyde dehydrogenase family protein [Arthrobacter sp. Z4-13]